MIRKVFTMHVDCFRFELCQLMFEWDDIYLILSPSESKRIDTHRTKINLYRQVLLDEIFFYGEYKWSTSISLLCSLKKRNTFLSSFEMNSFFFLLFFFSLKKIHWQMMKNIYRKDFRNLNIFLFINKSRRFFLYVCRRFFCCCDIHFCFEWNIVFAKNVCYFHEDSGVFAILFRWSK